MTFVAALITSCGNKSESSIEEEMASGVVLIQNQSYYEVELSNGLFILLVLMRMETS